MASAMPTSMVPIARFLRISAALGGTALEALEGPGFAPLIRRFQHEHTRRIMVKDDGFNMWLGRIGNDKPLRHALKAASVRSVVSRGRRSAFTGAIIGRGAGVGRVLASRDRSNWSTARRVMVKTRIVKLGPKGFKAAGAHLRYLERDGTTREGERGKLYGPDIDLADGKAFLERGEGDRHQFRFIVAPEDGLEFEDLKSLTRRLMAQAEIDLGTKLDWVAVDHFNTGHPHTHIMLRGQNDLGENLVIAREYLTQGLRERAVELVSLDLGPRTEQDIARSRFAQVEQDRFTDIDKSLLQSVGDDGLVRPAHPDFVEQSLRAGRLQKLGRMGLADEITRGTWKLDEQLEEKLRRIGEQDDIIRTMQRAMREKAPGRGDMDLEIYMPLDGETKPVVGRVVERGLSHEHADRRYLVIDGVDGKGHYVDIGLNPEPFPDNAIVRITPRSIAPHKFDRTVAEIAAAHHGRYNVDLHLAHDPRATEDFARRHVRRLEAIRRSTDGIERESNGTWKISPNHIEIAEAHERKLSARTPVLVETLSARSIDRLPEYEGPTWLDRELRTRDRTPLGEGFGNEVRNAMRLRQQWLVDQELVELRPDNMIRLAPNMLEKLEHREMARAVDHLSRKLGMPYADISPYEHEIDGLVKSAVKIGDSKFALLERSHEFSLVPWRPVLEDMIGKRVRGISRGDGGFDWEIGRRRDLDIGFGM
jgi:type IV secretory pathway VirD2 relaxase